jgi:pimeloyl-ACP methyl ester carboxylesterase
VSVYDPENPSGEASIEDAVALGNVLRDACDAFGIRTVEPVTEGVGVLGVEGVVDNRLGGHTLMNSASRALAARLSDSEATIKAIDECDPHKTFQMESIRSPAGSPINVYTRGEENLPAWVVVLPYGVPVEVVFELADRVCHQYRFVTFEGADLVSHPDEFDGLAHGIDASAGHILAVLDHCALTRVHLFGISGSAMSTVRFASMYPDRVASLVLGNGLYPGEKSKTLAMAAMMEKVRGSRDKTNIMCRYMCAQNLTRLEPDCPHLTMVPYVNRDLLYMFVIASRSIGKGAPLKEGEFDEWLSAVTCPTLVIICEKDTIVNPLDSHRIAGQLERCQKLVEENGSHLSLMFNPSRELVDATLEFCASHDV